VSSDSTRMCELLVGLPDVTVLEVIETDIRLRVKLETRGDRPPCTRSGGPVKVKDRRDVAHAVLPCFGQPTVSVGRKLRWACAVGCGAASFTETAAAIAAPRQKLTDRAGRWATFQVGHHGRAVSDVAADLGCDWRTVMNAVNCHGQALIDDPNRIGATATVGLGEVLFCRDGPFKHWLWSTQVLDVARGRLLEVVAGRDAASCCKWFAEQPVGWMVRICWATLDLSGSSRSVFDTMLPREVQIADPVHVVKLAKFVLDEVRRRVQNETCGHRGPKSDPLYRCDRQP
jgi:transposase